MTAAMMRHHDLSLPVCTRHTAFRGLHLVTAPNCREVRAIFPPSNAGEENPAPRSRSGLPCFAGSRSKWPQRYMILSYA